MEPAQIFRRGLLAASLALGACGAPPPPQQPNLLLIGVDTLRADRLSGYGYPGPTSPRIDAFLSQAAVFEDAQATSSWTLASFASLLTSLYPSSHRCASFATRLLPQYTTLAELLSERDYSTAGIVSHLFLGEKHGLSQGFERYDQELVLEDPQRSHEQISSPGITDRALAWLRGRASEPRRQPWFLFVHYFDPHSVYNPHAGFSERFEESDSGRYDGEIAFTDEHIGRLLEALSELDLAADTVVALVSDHGEEFGEHGSAHHGKTLHREVLQVPFAIRAPGLPPRRVRELVTIVDFLPTVLELLRIPLPEAPLAGRSLVPLMRGEPLEPRGALAELRLKPEFPADAYVLERWKLVAERGGDAPIFRLYDRQADPNEQTDLAAQNPEVVEDLRQRMRAALQAARAVGQTYRGSERVEHSERELEQLRALGYTR